MATFSMAAHFAMPKVPAPPMKPSGREVPLPSTLEDVRSMFLGYHYSLAKLPGPADGLAQADPRVGHFMTRHYEYTNDSAPFPRQYMVNRWRLEKKDPQAQLSEPVKPIVFWLDRNIPDEYRDTVKAGVLEWNKAFERIGFKDAVRVELQPDDADFDTADVRHASIRWYLDTSDGALAIGPSRVDPRTGRSSMPTSRSRRAGRACRGRLSGEQFPRPAPAARHAHGQDDQMLCAYGDEAFQEASFASGLLEVRGALDPNGPEADAIVKATLKDVVTHEVGHTLGLRHNFRASTIYTEAQLSDAAFTREERPGRLGDGLQRLEHRARQGAAGRIRDEHDRPLRLLGDRVRVQADPRRVGGEGARQDRGAQQRAAARLRDRRGGARRGCRGPRGEFARPRLRSAGLRPPPHGALA
jgi:hypothetical protein